MLRSKKVENKIYTIKEIIGKKAINKQRIETGLYAEIKEYEYYDEGDWYGHFCGWKTQTGLFINDKKVVSYVNINSNDYIIAYYKDKDNWVWEVLWIYSNEFRNFINHYEIANKNTVKKILKK
ncbi:hypothetical protein [Mucispirillum schaedleri]|uniref:hypothetical protein n=1 Tax=Mucispirillum schaedleri TaxID=248039 RepID=UPI001F5A297C|nr:hypothetical protein [Mucispirillum schaedleri]